jgi:hypothetical protein
MLEMIPPNEPVANALYRKALRKWALKSQANRDWLMAKCKEDYFFFITSFWWLIEPRPEEGESVIRPFVPWAHQIPMMETILKHLGYQDIGVDKARGEGASWIVLSIFVWRWLFWPLQSFVIVSRNQESADTPGNLGTLGAKIDWEMTMLPLWMTGRQGRGLGDGDWSRNVSKHSWLRHGSKSSIVALATTSDLASGSRDTAILLDEFAKFPRGDDEAVLSATEPVTNCRLLVSTYEGADGAYYRAMHEPSSMVKIILRWEDNPSRNHHLFCIDAKNSKLLAPGGNRPALMPDGYEEHFFEHEFKLLRARGFDVESRTKEWSPWYVKRCLRPRMTPKKIAQEYDRDPAGSGNSFFPPATIQVLRDRSRPPDQCGELEFHPETLFPTRFYRAHNGLFRLWFPLESASGRPPAGHYVVGVDVASGNGTCHASNSAISVVDRNTGCKVAEFASHTCTPERLAELAIATCRWFMSSSGDPAFLIWEANGYGGAVRERVLLSDFRNFYYRTPWKTTNKKHSKEPGWWSSKDAKRDLLLKYRWALTEGFFDNPSDQALSECLSYAEGAGGKIVFLGGANDDEDPTNAGEHHADRVIADALASYAIEQLGGGAVAAHARKKQQAFFDPPAGSFAYRQKARREQSCRDDEW